jgi:hypothetical protein
MTSGQCWPTKKGSGWQRKGKGERASKGGTVGGKNHPKVSLPDASTGKLKHNRPKESRNQAAKTHNVSERKVRQA